MGIEWDPARNLPNAMAGVVSIELMFIPWMRLLYKIREHENGLHQKERCQGWREKYLLSNNLAPYKNNRDNRKEAWQG